MNEVVSVAVMRVLLFVLHVYAEIVRGCDGNGDSGVGAGEVVVMVSAGCVYPGATRGLGFVSTIDNVLEISVVRGSDRCGWSVRNVYVFGSGLGRICGSEWVGIG